MLEKIKENINIKKLIAIVIIVVVAVQLIITIVVSESFLNVHKFSESEKADMLISKPLSSQNYIDWLHSKSEKITPDDTTLSAISIANNSTSHSYMLLFHPLTESPEDMATYAYHFYDLGFNVLIPDYIGEESSMGFYEKEIVLSWIDYVVELDESANIFLLGIGVGGNSMLLCTQAELPGNVKGIMADSVYSDLREVFSQNIKSVYGIASFPVVQLSSVYVHATRGWSFSQEDVRKIVRDSQVPILYIHGTEDSVVPVGQCNELYEVTVAEGTDCFTIYGAEHAQGLNTDSEKYWREVDAFIRNCL